MRRLLLIVLCALLLCVGVSAAQTEITALSAEVTVEQDGSCSLQVTAQVSFAGSEERFVFPLSADAEKITASGGEYKIRWVDGVRCAVFSNAHGFAGSQSFTCTYSLPRAVTNVTGGQSFDLSLPEKGWEYAIDAYSLHVTFPVEITARPDWSSAYYQDIIDNYLDVQITGTELSAASRQAFQDQETLHLALLFPQDSFRLRHLPGSMNSFGQIAFFVLLLAAVLYWLLFLRDRLLIPKKQRTYGMEATAGEVPCQLFGELPDLAATLAHWGNLGYIAVYRNSRGRIILRKRMEMGNERKPAEQKWFAALFRASDTCDLQGSRFHALARPAAANLRRGWEQRLFRQNSGNPRLLQGLALLAAFFAGVHLFDAWIGVTAWRWVLIPLLSLLCAGLCILVQRAIRSLLHPRSWRIRLAGLASAVLLLALASQAGCTGMMFLNLLLQAFCALATLFGGRRTPVGHEQVRQLLGLRGYLKKADPAELSRLSELDGQFFYRLLPFADTLGVGRAFCKRFSALSPEPCPWLSDAHFTPKDARDFYALYQDIFSAVRDSAASTPSLPARDGRKKVRI